MKIKTTKWIALLAFAGLAITPSAKAAAQLGDLIFGVYSTNAANANVYLFDLGAAPPSSSTVASSLGADLTALFGAGWYTDTTLRWGISGYDAAGNTDISKVETTAGTQSAAYGVQSAASLNTVNGKLDNVNTQFNSPTNGYTASGGAQALKSDVNGYFTYAPSGFTNFGANFSAAGFSGKELDIWSLAGGGPNTYVGSFVVNSNGDVIFQSTPAGSATPEAGGALSLMALGLGCLVTMRRRLVSVLG